MQVTRRHFLTAGLSFIGTLLVGCNQSAAKTSQGGLVADPGKDQWPEPYWREAPPEVKEAYRFAVANPQVLQYMPCYCGCVQDGHTSNKSCYVKEFRRDGTVVLDLMSFG